MSVLTDPAVPALLIMVAGAVFLLHGLFRVFFMYWKRGRKPWNQAQQRFGRITAAISVAVVAAFAALAYLTFSVPLTFWHAAAFTAFVAAYGVVATWYEQRLFALADAH